MPRCCQLLPLALAVLAFLAADATEQAVRGRGGGGGEQQPVWRPFSGASTSTTVVPHELLFNGLSTAAGAMHGVGLGVREELQLRLVPLER